MHELLTPLQMKKADRLTIEGGIPGIELMHNAGKAVFEVIRQILHPYSRVLVLCGPGNNGGDGFVVAQLADNEGFNVSVGLVGNVETLEGDAELAYDEMELDLISLENMRMALEELGEDDVIVDALFGAGLSRGLDDELLDIVEQINGSPAQCVAIDLPSGVNGKTGAVLGEAAVRADMTVTFFRAKPGHYLFPGRAHCGEVIIEQIGLEDEVLKHIGPTAYYNCDKIWGRVPDLPEVAGHKYGRGHTVVVSGPKFSTGASRLAALGAQRAGSGLVTVVAREQAALIHAAHLTSVMIRPAERIADLERILEDERLNSVVIGPAAGLGRETQERVAECLSGERGVVLDADALMSFEEMPAYLFEYIAGSSCRGKVVLTPHEASSAGCFLICVTRPLGIARLNGRTKRQSAQAQLWSLKERIPLLRTLLAIYPSMPAVHRGWRLPGLVMFLPELSVVTLHRGWMGMRLLQKVCGFMAVPENWQVRV